MSQSVKNTGFYCTECHNFTEREDVEDKFIVTEPVPGDENTFVEFTKCPFCGGLAKEAGLNFRGISKINLNKLQTGPTTPEGRAKLAKLAPTKLHGPKTKEGKERSAKNAWKHGKYAKEMRELAPAKFDKFPFCADCTDEYREKCKKGELKWCMTYIGKSLEIYGFHVNGDIEGLSKYAAMTHANLELVKQMML